MATRGQQKHADVAIANAYVNRCSNSKMRGLDFTLSFDAFKKILQQKHCFYTGMPLNENNFSIDRIDSSIGYTEENSVACHRQFNMLKGTIENPSNSLTIQDCAVGLLKAANILLRSENPSKRKLTDAEIVEVRNSTGRLVDVAKRYGIAVGTVSKIKTGKLYSGVTE